MKRLLALTCGLILVTQIFADTKWHYGMPVSMISVPYLEVINHTNKSYTVGVTFLNSFTQATLPFSAMGTPKSTITMNIDPTQSDYQVHLDIVDNATGELVYSGNSYPGVIYVGLNANQKLQLNYSRRG